MWYPKMWLVVKPSVGLPLFFAGVAATSLIVHAAVLTHTTWYPAFYEGHSKAALTSSTAARPAAADGAISTPSVVINVAK